MALGKLAVVVVIVAATVVLAALAEEEKYTSKYDHVDVNQILSNPRLRNQYVRCTLGTAPCLSGDAKFLKDKFPEVIVTKCRKCTDKQVEFFEKITEWFTTNEPETWNLLVANSIERYHKQK